MRKKIVAGNWKMNKTLEEGVQLAWEVNEFLKQNSTSKQVSVILGVPFIHLAELRKIPKKHIGIAAQNCADEASGAYTGEVSASMIQSAGSEYVILGHSERRAYYGENDETLIKKVNLALENNLQPIFCIGESLEDRNANKHFDLIEQQISKALFHLSDTDFKKLILAYEPIWAIGTGITATAEQAQEMHAFIRKTLSRKYGESIANQISILYGGSCNPSNAKELFNNKDVDGGLIGGASLNAENFIQIITTLS